MRSDRKRPIMRKIEDIKSTPQPTHNIRDNIEGVSVDKLIKEYGSPLFVFSQKIIKEQYSKAYEAFSSRYANVEFSWSYKTNYLKSICAIFHQLGSSAEVVSEFEYQKARNLGIEGKDIIFNGPYKPYHILKIAVEEGAKIHIDNFEEIDTLEKIADELDMQIPVAIRVNMDTESIYPQWSRFGFDLDSNEALEAIKKIKTGGRLILNGLHSHIGTFMLDANAYGVETQKMVKLLNTIEEDFGFNIEYIDIGGGFASMNRLKGVSQPPKEIVPSIDDYAKAITNALRENLKPSSNPKLYLELGRYLIDEAGFLITTVVANRLMSDGKRAYVVDAGINLLHTYMWYDFNIEISKENKTTSESSMINGPLCMNGDVIRDSIMLPRLDNKTKLIISPVGAYSVTQWMQFITYRPAIVLIFEDGEVEVIRQKEDLKYMEKQERLPKRLKLKDDKKKKTKKGKRDE